MKNVLRLYITGRVAAERGSRVATENRFPSRQARLLFACLVLERAKPLTRDALADILWPERRPAAWETSLKALVSKLRGFFDELDGTESEGGRRILSEYGCYQLVLPVSAWVDWEAAKGALDEAEGALRRNDARAAWGPANVAIAIARRDFLPSESGPWTESKRLELASVLLRALDAYADVCLATGQVEPAVAIAAEAVSREPFRETSYQRLMKAHAALGNRAEALRVYHRCRELLRDELGVSPSPETEAVYLELLKKNDRSRAR